MAPIAGGLLPAASVGEPWIPIAPIRLDRRLVTAGEFAAFVRRRPAWRRSRIDRLRAEPDYLKTWRSDLDPGDEAARARPVTHVSWFAARAFCAAASKRLPSTSEWEYAARNGDPEFARKALDWYGHPTPVALPAAGSTPPDRNGVRDLGAIVWEWTEDFNSELPPEASACGGGAAGAADRSDYAAFMRRAFRGSLRGRFTLGVLGFRCATAAAAAVPARSEGASP